MLVAGIGLAALRSGSPAWATAMLSIMFFVMTCPLLGAVLDRGLPKTFWSGFATLG